MTPTSLIIVADRGSLKAYRVNETPTRGPSLKLVQAFDVTDAHGKLIDKVTDLAGRYVGAAPPARARIGSAIIFGAESEYPVQLSIDCAWMRLTDRLEV